MINLFLFKLIMIIISKKSHPIQPPFLGTVQYILDTDKKL